MTKKEATIGTIVRSNRDFHSVPLGTEGVIDWRYTIGEVEGIVVAWDLPDKPLPKGWKYIGQSAAEPGVPRRDGFAADELHFLDLVL